MERVTCTLAGKLWRFIKSVGIGTARPRSMELDQVASASPPAAADEAGTGRALFVEGWEFMQTLGEGAYSE